MGKISDLFDDAMEISRGNNFTISLDEKEIKFDTNNFRNRYMSLLRGRFLTSNNVTQKKNNFILKQAYRPTRPGSVKHFAYSRFFLPSLEKCRKDAYLGHLEEIHELYHALYKILRNSASKGIISMSKESLSEGTLIWALHQIPLTSSKFFIRFHSLWHSGQVEFWENWKTMLVTRKSLVVKAFEEHEARQPKKLDLFGNVVVVFYLYLLSITISIIFFFWEVIKLIAQCATNLFVQFCQKSHLVEEIISHS